MGMGAPNSHKEIRVIKYLYHKTFLSTVMLKEYQPLTLYALCKWGHFDRVKPTLKMLLASWTFYKIKMGLRSLNAENLGSVDQRA